MCSGAGLESQGALHLFTHQREAFDITATDFGGSPAGEVDVVESFLDFFPGKVAFSDIGEFVSGAAESLHV